MFQVIRQRYKKGSTIVNSDKAFTHWWEIFDNDAKVTSAVLVRFFHRSKTVVFEGRRFAVLIAGTIAR